jgi:uncharacterized protein (DUF983 family)
MDNQAREDSLRPWALALSQKCPRCGIGDLYNPGLTLTVRDVCAHCGLALARNDSADGPAVFLIFVLGFLLVPAALILETVFAPPLWVHVVVWSAVALGATIGAMRPLKAYVIALQFKHRASDWDQ